MRKLKEDVPTMSAGAGQIAGIGVGPQGEPGVDMKARRKKWKKAQQKSIPTPTVSEDTASLSDIFSEMNNPNVITQNTLTREDLRNWFGTGKTGGVGGSGWDRYNTSGERIGKCGDADNRGGNGEGKPKCLSKEKAAKLRAQGGKNAIANAVKRKKDQDPVTNRRGTGSAPRPVSNRIGESVLSEKNVPTNPSLWSRAKSEAKKRFDVYPSAYANGWASKWYKSHGGGWKTEAKESVKPNAVTKAIEEMVVRTVIEYSPSPNKPWEVVPYTIVDAKSQKDAFNKAVNYATRLHNYDTAISQGDNPALQIRVINKIDGGRRKNNEAVSPAQQAAIAINMKKAGKTPAHEENTPTDREWGTDSLVDIYKKDTPGELAERVAELTVVAEVWKKITTCQQCKTKLSPREQKLGFRICDQCVAGNKNNVWGKDSDDDYVEEDCGCGDPAQAEERLSEASEYQGRKVTLGKPFRTPDGPKKFSVYVNNDKGNVVKVNFGDPEMEIKRDDPDRKKNYRARHNCDTPGPRWKANYWSCRMWSRKSVSDITEATVVGHLIATPKRGGAIRNGKGFWKIGDDVYLASMNGAMDVYGLPMDKRWESTYVHFARYWDSVYGKHYDKTKAWK